MSQGNFFSDSTGYNAAQLNIQTGTMGAEVVFDGFKMGTHTVIASEQTAGTLDIDTGITINGFIVQIYRSGVQASLATVTSATTVLTIATNGANYVVTTGDVINYLVF